MPNCLRIKTSAVERPKLVRLAMLQVLIKRLVFISQGENVDIDLNSPFTFLHGISESVDSPIYWSKSSKWIQLGASPRGAPNKRRSSASNSPSKEFESPWVPQPNTNVAAFLAGLRFEKRDLLSGHPTIPLLTGSSQGIGNRNSES